MDIEQEIMEIKARNARVEADKAWEISQARKIAIALTTYVAMVILMITIHTEKPFLAAIVPTCGFLLSTLSMGIVKKIWLRRRA